MSHYLGNDTNQQLDKITVLLFKQLLDTTSGYKIGIARMEELSEKLEGEVKQPEGEYEIHEPSYFDAGNLKSFPNVINTLNLIDCSRCCVLFGANLFVFFCVVGGVTLTLIQLKNCQKLLWKI
jgi:hypothetical protein